MRLIGELASVALMVKLLWDSWRGRLEPMIGLGAEPGRGRRARRDRAAVVPAVGGDPAGARPRRVRFRTAATVVSAVVAMLVPPTGSTFDGRAYVLPTAAAAAAVVLVVAVFLVRGKLPLLPWRDPRATSGRPGPPCWAPVRARREPATPPSLYRRGPASRTSGPGMPAVEVSGLVKRYGSTTAVDGLDLRLAAGSRARPARPERRRQDHHRRDLRGLPQAPTPARSACSASTRPPRVPRCGRGSASCRRAAAPTRACAPTRCCALVAACAAHPLDPAWLLDVLGPGRRCGARRTSGSPAASSSGCRWRARWSAGRNWCSSTSRPPAWTRRPGGWCGTWSRALRADGVSVLLTTHLMEEAEALADHGRDRRPRQGRRRRARPAELTAARRTTQRLRFRARARPAAGPAGRRRCPRAAPATRSRRAPTR